MSYTTKIRKFTPKSNFIRGMRAKMSGRQYENYFCNSVKGENFAIIRLPESGARWISKNKYIPQNIPCDIIIGFKNKTALIDLKSIEGERFTYTMVWSKPHQAEGMHDFLKNQGCWTAGFIIFFQKNKSIVFFHVNKLVKLKKYSSLKKEDGLQIGIISSDPADKIQISKIFNNSAH